MHVKFEHTRAHIAMRILFGVGAWIAVTSECARVTKGCGGALRAPPQKRGVSAKSLTVEAGKCGFTVD